jgi:class 3 adenylate cyclase
MAGGAFIGYAIHKVEDELEQAHQRCESLLHNILPIKIAERLKREHQTPADNFDSASILFADIVGFTEMSHGVHANEVVSILNNVFTRFDDLVEKYGLEKIKTIGDAYMVAGGIPEYRQHHAEAIADLALDMMRVASSLSQTSKKPFLLRIGVNSGPIVAGVIGKKKFAYDLWGDAVNTASRMESHGLPGEIQVTEATYELLREGYEFAVRGFIEVKGKGLMKTYLLKDKKSPDPASTMLTCK